jgi:hypothetical protein
MTGDRQEHSRSLSYEVLVGEARYGRRYRWWRVWGGGYYKYELTADYVHPEPIEALRGRRLESSHLRLSPDGVLTIRAGYAWDGPSGPAPDLACLLRAALVHDALYQLIRVGALDPTRRRAADRLLGRTARQDCAPRSMCAVAVGFVRLFGRPSTWPREEGERRPSEEYESVG